ncbi:MAG: hypothetical protein WBJ62_06090 [Coriobacteriia bacterium]
MSARRSGRRSRRPDDRAGHTPEEQAAFEERIDALEGYGELVDDAREAESASERAELQEASSRGTSASELSAIMVRHRGRWAVGLLMLALALACAITVAITAFYERGTDLTAGLAGDDSDAIEDIAPPEPAETPQEVLPPEVFTYACADCGDTTVVQVPLDLNKDARYQFAYEAGGSRIAIFTVVDGAEYDTMAEALEAEYARALSDGLDVEAPRYLDDVGEGGMVYESTAIFRNRGDCGTLWANTLQDAGGDEFVTITPDELERLARVAAPRM